jgi:hypothetical protein
MSTQETNYKWRSLVTEVAPDPEIISNSDHDKYVYIDS